MGSHQQAMSQSALSKMKLTRFSNSALSSINGWNTLVNMIEYDRVSPTTPALRSTAEEKKKEENIWT